MDLHVVWGWLDSVLNGCKRCFCYIIVHLTVQLCCIVKLFCMLFLQKMLKQIGGLVFLTFLGDRRNVSGWVQPNLFKKSDGKEREPIALIVVPHLRNFESVFYFIFTCETRQKKKVWGSDFFIIIHLWNRVKNTEWHWVQIYRWNKCFFYFMSETDCLFFPCLVSPMRKKSSCGKRLHEENIILKKNSLLALRAPVDPCG